MSLTWGGDERKPARPAVPFRPSVVPCVLVRKTDEGLILHNHRGGSVCMGWVVRARSRREAADVAVELWMSEPSITEDL